MPIKNRDELIAAGNTVENKKGREIILNLMEQAINTVLPENIIKENIKLIDNKLYILGDKLDLDTFSKIYIVGGGKASGRMALEIVSILKHRITEGVINIVKGTANEFQNVRNIQFIEAGHPIPTSGGIEGTKKMIEILENTNDDDLVICLISGGGSAMIELPNEPIKLEDLQELTKHLLKSGMDINEMNTIRKHCSQVKGGQLIKACKARVISLILSDVLGDPLEMIASGPTTPDSTTFNDVKNIIKKYKLENNLPNSIKAHLEKGYLKLIEDTPKEDNPIFRKVKNYILGNINSACEVVVKIAKDLGLSAQIISTKISGEACKVGLALIEKIMKSPKKTLLVGGGETTVIVRGNGNGGRNQEMILSACKKLNRNGIVISAIDIDGIDGNSDAAGAIADYSLIIKAKEKKLNINDFLTNNDSYNFFKKVGDGLIFTGYTGTNVNSIYLLLSL